MNKKYYNTTELDVLNALDRNILHRDRLAHYFRWGYVGRFLTKGDDIVDFGCGKGELAKVLYSNQCKPSKYIGLDIKKIKIVTPHNEDKAIEWAETIQVDLIKPHIELPKAKKVVSFEVLEHVGKQNIDIFLQNFKSCGYDDSTYYLSTPCYDDRVGAAGNHTYDSGDGRGVVGQEFERQEVINALDKNGFEIVKNYGTFASMRNYKHLLDQQYPGLYDRLNEYYYSHVMGIIFAPLFPEHGRNNIWILKQKQTDLFTEAVDKGEW